MKKFTLSFMFVLILAVSACAEVKLPIRSYYCQDCDTYFYCIEGDDLADLKLSVPSNQINRVFKLSNHQGHLQPCKGKLIHSFEYNTTRDMPISQVLKYADKIAVIKDGPKLKCLESSSWWCVNPGCNDPFIIYSLQNDSFILRDWEQQPDKIINMKTLKGIVKCSMPYSFGHAFHYDSSKHDVPISSYSFAEMLGDFYYVKN